MARPSKRDMILNAASELFIVHGYRRVTIDQIVEAVPISKPTLYAHFTDKAALFIAVIERYCGRLLAEMEATVASGHAVENTLFDIGYQFLNMVLSQPSIQLHRMLTAEVSEFPEVARLFYNSGPQQMHSFLTAYLMQEHKKGRLTVTDPALSADMFLSMIKGYIHLQRLLGIGKPPGKRQMRQRVQYAVDFFLRAHRVS